MTDLPDRYRYTPKKEPISILHTSRQSDYCKKYVHMHNHTEMLFITSRNDALVFNNGNRLKLQTPALIIHKAGSYHYTEAYATAGEGYSSDCIFFDMKYLEQIPEGFLHSRELFRDDCMVVPLTGEQKASFEEWLRLLHTQSGYHKKMLFLLLIILDEVVRILSDAATVRLNNPDNYIFDVTQYLITHFSESLTTAQLAQQFHVSISKINADFNRVTNRTIKDFCTALRLEQADRMLRETDAPISQIAYSCGFSSESYLIQAFRRHTGTTPNNYRKKHAEEAESRKENG